MARVSATLVAALALPTLARNNLARTPPMGWMSWEIFRCNLATPADNCTDKATTNCISSALYEGQADAMVAGEGDSFAASGYNSIHMDDCWEQQDPPRDPTTHELRADFVRFPNGMKGMGQYIHGKGLQYAIYTAESTETCGGYPASQGYEALDAKTFASWDVDYIKVDGCGDNGFYPEGYAAMGAALEASGRDIVYSCSWPAYIGDNETEKPFDTFIMDGCNLWRNWDDIQCSWGSLSSIINHWGDWGSVLAPWAGPGHWHDPDMLLIGNGCITNEEERSQMAIWSIVAAPLIMGNDMRNVSAASRSILINPRAIAIDQDPLGQMGIRVNGTSASATQVWARNLANGDIAVAAFNPLGGLPPPSPCPSWAETKNGYYHSCGGVLGSFSGLTLAQAEEACCANPLCAGLLWDGVSAGDYHVDLNCGFANSTTYNEYAKPGFVPPVGSAVDVTVWFTDLGLAPAATCAVMNVWSGQALGTFTGSYTASAVPYHGTAFLRLTC